MAIALAQCMSVGALWAQENHADLSRHAAAHTEPPAQTVRLAVFHADLARAGPGLLLRDLLLPKVPPDILRAAQIIAEARPEILLLQGFDYDAGNVALSAFNRLIGNGEPHYPHVFAARPNTGWMTAHDLNGDGATNSPRDAQGYGRFSGEGGMAILSNRPLVEVTDLSAMLWQSFPRADLPHNPDGSLFPSAEAMGVQRLSTTAHWDVEVELAPGKPLHLLAFHATPPGFDGPEDRSGRRAKDEHRLWQAYLSGELAQPPPTAPFVVMGTSNLDPDRGDGDRQFMRSFLADPRWQDPPQLQDQPTAFWPMPLGEMRVSYLLPAAALRVKDGGIAPLKTGPPRQTVTWTGGARHERDEQKAAAPLVRHLVWIDLAID